MKLPQAAHYNVLPAIELGECPCFRRTRPFVTSRLTAASGCLNMPSSPVGSAQVQTGNV